MRLVEGAHAVPEKRASQAASEAGEGAGRPSPSAARRRHRYRRRRHPRGPVATSGAAGALPVAPLPPPQCPSPTAPPRGPEPPRRSLPTAPPSGQEARLQVRGPRLVSQRWLDSARSLLLALILPTCKRCHHEMDPEGTIGLWQPCPSGLYEASLCSPALPPVAALALGPNSGLGSYPETLTL